MILTAQSIKVIPAFIEPIEFSNYFPDQPVEIRNNLASYINRNILDIMSIEFETLVNKSVMVIHYPVLRMISIFYEKKKTFNLHYDLSFQGFHLDFEPDPKSEFKLNRHILTIEL